MIEKIDARLSNWYQAIRKSFIFERMYLFKKIVFCVSSNIHENIKSDFWVLLNENYPSIYKPFEGYVIINYTCFSNAPSPSTVSANQLWIFLHFLEMWEGPWICTIGSWCTVSQPITTGNENTKVPEGILKPLLDWMLPWR